jgi:uncharacterized membrane protein YfcA
MTELSMIDPTYAYSIAGFAIGALVGITGVGGGSLMTPILILFGVGPLSAVGTDLLYASITKSAGSLVHGWNRTVDWRIVTRLMAGSVPASALTLFTLYALYISQHDVQTIVTRVLGVALFFTALSLIFRRRLAKFVATHVPPPDPGQVRWLTIAAGVLLGVLVSISSVGAGALGVTFLILLYPEVPMARIVGSDIAHAVPLTLVAGLGHLALGTVNVALLLSLLAGSLPGIFIGSLMSVRLPERAVRLTLAAALILVCGKMLFY